MKKKQNKIFVFVLLSCILVSCRPDNVISEKEMVDVLTDVQLAQGVYQTRFQDFQSIESKDALLAGILKKYNITEADLDSSLVYYSDNVDKLIRINDSVRAQLQRKLSVMEESSNARDGIKSKIPGYVILDDAASIFKFSLAEYEISKIGNNLDWTFNTLGLHDNMKLKASARFKYADTTFIINEVITTDIYQSIKASHASKLIEVDGYIHLSQPIYSPVIIYNMRLNPLSLKRNIEVISAIP